MNLWLYWEAVAAEGRRNKFQSTRNVFAHSWQW